MLVSFSNVFKAYDDFGNVLDGVNFEIEEGEFTALAGPSGSGKTTILNLCAGLDFATDGAVSLMDMDLKSLDRKTLLEMRRNFLGIVFQSYNLFPVFTASENVEYPLALNRYPAHRRISLVKEALRDVGLQGLDDRFPGELSGGQQQRVAVARALVTAPKVVFADEPTANLDSRTAEGLLELFVKLNREKGITFLFSTHDPRVLAHARRVIQVMDGRISHEDS